MSTTIGNILAPTSAEDFLTNYYGKKSLFVEGTTNKFSGLFTHADLNALVQAELYASTSFVVLRDGKTLYKSGHQTGDIGQSPTPTAINEILEKDALMVVSDVAGYNDQLLDLHRVLVETFQVPCKLGLFVSWGNANGLGIHVDPTDTLVIQLFGTKQWKTYGPTEHYPATHTDGYQAPALSVRPESPEWERVLKPGDLLYLPKGYIHEASGTNTCSAHLSIMMLRPTGVDLFGGLVHAIKSDNRFRRDLPRPDEIEACEALVKDIRVAIEAKIKNQCIKGHWQARPYLTQTRSPLRLPNEPASYPDGKTMEEEVRNA